MKKKSKGAGRKPAPAGNPQLLLRIPDVLGPRLLRDAVENEQTVQAVILGIVAEHYGVEVAAPQRGKPKKNVEV